MRTVNRTRYHHPNTQSVKNVDGIQPEYQNIKPFIHDNIKQIAWNQFLTGHGNLHVVHIRKAGGTTLKRWMNDELLNNNHLNKFLQVNNITWKQNVEATEMYTGIHRPFKRNFIDHLLSNRGNDSLFAISLKHPIDRILSQYEFEWKWGCVLCCQVHMDIIQQQNNDTNDTYSNMNVFSYFDRINIDDNWWVNDSKCKCPEKYKFSGITFEDLVQRLEIFWPHGKHSVRGNGFKNTWAYINNYYLYVFCCTSSDCNIQRDFIETGKMEECFNSAISKIKSFDIILLTDWFNDMRSSVYVNRLLFGKLPNYTYYGENNMRPKPYPHKVQNRGLNYMIDRRTYNKLLEWNKWDLKFFNFVEKLAYDRLHDIWDEKGAHLSS